MVLWLLSVIYKNTSWSAAFCGPKNGQCYSVNKALFCLQGVYDGFFIFFFSCLGGYPLRVYLWRLSLRNNFPTLSFPVFSVYRPANIPVWPSSAGEIGEAREFVLLFTFYLSLRVAGLGFSSKHFSFLVTWQYSSRKWRVAGQGLCCRCNALFLLLCFFGLGFSS